MTERKVRKEPRNFRTEFKKQIVAKLASGEATANELSKQYNIRAGMIYRWRRELRDGEIDLKVNKAPRTEQSGVDPRYVRQLEEKLREASEELGKLYLVVEGLKKIHQEPKSTKNANSFVVTGTSWARSKGRAK